VVAALTLDWRIDSLLWSSPFPFLYLLVGFQSRGFRDGNKCQK